MKPTLRAKGIAMPTMNKKKGMTKSARLQPFHGACAIIGHSPPASSTKIISYNRWLVTESIRANSWWYLNKKVKGFNYNLDCSHDKCLNAIFLPNLIDFTLKSRLIYTSLTSKWRTINILDSSKLPPSIRIWANELKLQGHFLLSNMMFIQYIWRTKSSLHIK